MITKVKQATVTICSIIHNISLHANKINWLSDATFLVVIHNPREEYMLIQDIDWISNIK